MRKGLMLFPIFSLLVLMIFPAYAAVDSVSLEKSFYTNEESFVFVGVEELGKKLVSVVIRGPGGNFIDIVSATSDSNGQFSTFPRSVESIFTIRGTYNATAFTDQQSDGISIQLDYDGDKLVEKEDFVLTLKTIPDKTVTEGKTLSFSVSVTDSSLDGLTYSLEKNPPSGASINSDSGKFIWTPTTAQGNTNGIQYNFDIVVEKGTQKDSESITITVKDPITSQPEEEVKDEPQEKPKKEPKVGVASFVDQSKDPQSYVDRYNNEPSYKKWFDDNYPEYDSIYIAVGLDEPLAIPAPFVDQSKDPQSYVDRYNNEPSYKKWFDANYQEYSSIYQAVGLKEIKEIAVFVDLNQDPQYYVDRYDNEPTYKEWFDENFPEYDSIYEAVGLDEPEVIEPEIGECGPGTDLIDGICELIDPPKSGGGCLIATATYGSEMAPQVQLLREIRDNKLMSTEVGSSFITGFNEFYYSFSPVIADYERENPVFKEAIKLGITPLISSLVILDYADSEDEIIGYGISLLVLNIGMYIVVPAIVIYKARKFVKI
ncbi:MAG: hypothetical protein IIA19_07125 [Thaumarchaeota archaeon]|nr:hypothetical protein [Nitrososphaerota archaeon]